MRRALTAFLALASTTASADEPAAPEDPKQAMRDRGVVLKAGKKHYFVIVPPVPGTTTAPASSKFSHAKFYFGEPTQLRLIGGGGGNDKSVEDAMLSDPRQLFHARLERNAHIYTLGCTPIWNRQQTPRQIALTTLDKDAAEDVIDAVKIVDAQPPYLAFLLARVSGTTYLYVDRRGDDGADFRVFLGKRGAMRKIAIKDVASDANGVVLVTAKGTLTAQRDNPDQPSATWGSAKKPAKLATLARFENRGLIYRELGIYTKERSGHPCEEL